MSKKNPWVKSVISVNDSLPEEHKVVTIVSWFDNKDYYTSGKGYLAKSDKNESSWFSSDGTRICNSVGEEITHWLN
jgi:hypothetical protein